MRKFLTYFLGLMSCLLLAFSLFVFVTSPKKTFLRRGRIDPLSKNQLKKKIQEKKQIPEKEIQINVITQKNKSPVSLKNKVSNIERKWIGDKINSKKPLQFINTPHPGWKKRLKYNLTRFLVNPLPSKEKKKKTVKIEIENRFIFVENNMARYIENVKITFFNAQKKQISSYNGHVDSESGKFIGRPWNHTVQR